MGAHDFTDMQWGSTVEEAFSVGQQRALYEFGHNAYNGTISTVQDFVEFTKPRSLSDDEFIELVWWVRDRGDMDPGFVTDPWTSAPPRNVRLKALPDLPVKRKFDHEAQRRQYQRQRALLTKAKKLSQQDLNLVATAAMSIQKWTSCVAFRACQSTEQDVRKAWGYVGKRGGVWHFFGMAAC